MGAAAASRLTNASTGGVDGSTVGNSGGLQSFVITVATLPAYTLSNTLAVTVSNPVEFSTSTVGVNVQVGNGPPSGTTTISINSVTGVVSFAGSDTPSNIVQPTMVMNYMIYHGVYS